jgi:hypothetical protein
MKCYPPILLVRGLHKKEKGKVSDGEMARDLYIALNKVLSPHMYKTEEGKVPEGEMARDL